MVYGVGRIVPVGSLLCQSNNVEEARSTDPGGTRTRFSGKLHHAAMDTQIVSKRQNNGEPNRVLCPLPLNRFKYCNWQKRQRKESETQQETNFMAVHMIKFQSTDKPIYMHI